MNYKLAERILLIIFYSYATILGSSPADTISLHPLIIFYSYATILGSSPADTISLHPSVPCLPDLSSHENSSVMGSLRLGKYTEWFNDVFSPDILNKCEDALSMFSETHGCKIGGDSNEYTDADIDDIREEWAIYVSNFIFR